MTVSFKRDDKQDVSIKLRRQTQIRKSVCTPVLLDKSLTQTSQLWGLHSSPTIVLYAPGLQNNLSFQEPQKIKK